MEIVLVSDTFKYVYIRIPRTASHSLTAWCKQTAQARKHGRYHGYDVPELYQSYYIWSCVRNPYDRCYSYWCLGLEKNPSLDFVEFMNTLIDSREDSSRPACRTQSRFVELANIKKVIHIENIDNEIKELRFYSELQNKFYNIPDIPVRHTSERKGDISTLGKRAKELVVEYCKEDFLNFGYRM